MKKGKVHTTLNRLTQRLEDEQIDYAILGGMALAAHGYERFTTDVDVLTTREGLEKIHAVLVGRGYLPAFPGSRKTLRDTATGVTIDFITAGEFPGDSKTKPVSFPDPSTVTVEYDGYRVIDLAHLVELKLASGLSAALRAKDLGDIQELIIAAKPPRELGEQLDASVRDEYYRMWDAAQNAKPVWNE